MRIVWDEPKRLATLAVRGLDFAIVTPEFFDTAKILPAKGGRFIALGLVEGRPYAVVFKLLGTEAISLISLRPASVRERRIL